MQRPRSSSRLFAGVLVFAMALVCWWTVVMWRHGGALVAAADSLAAGDPAAVAVALGATEGDLAGEGRRLRSMFLSEGIVFLLLLCGAGLLYRAAIRREERVRALQDRFLTGATHELKTPLATIKLGLETLGRNGLPAERRQHYLRSMQGEVDRLEQGARNLLAAAGLRSAGPPLNLADGDLVCDVREVLAELRPTLVAKGRDVQLRRVPTSLPFRRDAEAFRLVLRNLVENAIKYSSTDVVVELTLEPASDSRSGRAMMDVIDAGRGLVGAEPHQAFEPYWRAADQSAGGAGLGLHVVKELVEAHGGTVDAISAGRGQGSTFRVVWVATQTSADASEPAGGPSGDTGTGEGAPGLAGS